MKTLAFGQSKRLGHLPRQGRKATGQIAPQASRNTASTSRNPLGIWNQFGSLFPWTQGHTRQHFGPACRLPDLFERKDRIYLDLYTKRLQWISPPPLYHHDLLHAAVRVGHIEARTGYNFKNKFLCIEALKNTGKNWPLYYKGVVVEIDRNNRLALLGDRVLGLALCEIWFHSGHSTGNYSVMNSFIETRAALNVTGRAMKLHQDILLQHELAVPANSHVAEAFEAIIGAIYVDSGHNVPAVKEVLKHLGIDNHEFLQTVDSELARAQEKKELKQDIARFKFQKREITRAALRRQKGKRERTMDRYKKDSEQSHAEPQSLSRAAEVFENEAIANAEKQIARQLSATLKGKQLDPQRTQGDRLPPTFPNQTDLNEPPSAPPPQLTATVLQQVTQSQLECEVVREAPKKDRPKEPSLQERTNDRKREVEQFLTDMPSNLTDAERGIAWGKARKAWKKTRKASKKTKQASNGDRDSLFAIYGAQLRAAAEKKEAAVQKTKSTRQHTKKGKENPQAAHAIIPSEQANASVVGGPTGEQYVNDTNAGSKDQAQTLDSLPETTKASSVHDRPPDTPEAAAEHQGQGAIKQANAEEEEWSPESKFASRKRKARMRKEADEMARAAEQASSKCEESQKLHARDTTALKSKFQKELEESDRSLSSSTPKAVHTYPESEMDMFLDNVAGGKQVFPDTTQQKTNLPAAQIPHTATDSHTAVVETGATKQAVEPKTGSTELGKATNPAPVQDVQPSAANKGTLESESNGSFSMLQSANLVCKAEDDGSMSGFETGKATTDPAVASNIISTITYIPPTHNNESMSSLTTYIPPNLTRESLSRFTPFIPPTSTKWLPTSTAFTPSPYPSPKSSPAIRLWEDWEAVEADLRTIMKVVEKEKETKDEKTAEKETEDEKAVDDDDKEEKELKHQLRKIARHRQKCSSKLRTKQATDEVAKTEEILATIEAKGARAAQVDTEDVKAADDEEEEEERMALKRKLRRIMRRRRERYRKLETKPAPNEAAKAEEILAAMEALGAKAAQMDKRETDDKAHKPARDSEVLER